MKHYTVFHLSPTLLIFAVSLWCISARSAGPSANPATVTKEADLVLITLTPDAEDRLRLKTVTLEMQLVPEVRIFSGQIVIPLGNAKLPNSPVLNGTLAELLLIGDQQATADGRVLEATAALKAASIAFDRAQKIRLADAGSTRSVDEAKANLEIAEAIMVTAERRRELLGNPISSLDATSKLWIRVPIYTGELPRLDSHASSSVSALGKTETKLNAIRVQGPSTADILTNTVDWYYEFETNTGFRAGERVAVEIPTVNNKIERLVVPTSSVLHDIHGGQWIYENIREHDYARRRVRVLRFANQLAVLAAGPKVGAKIVTDGAAELFGTEFMTGK